MNIKQEITRKLYMTALVAFVLTFSIELFQYFTGRISDVDDLIANLLGGIIEYGIFKICSYLFENKTWWDRVSTGFDYEPWHCRYVGKQHAKAIYEKGLVLEEYLNTL